jgi:hypothetical protein
MRGGWTALLLALGPTGSLLAALAVVGLAALAAAQFGDLELAVGAGFLAGLVLAAVLARQPRPRLLALRGLLLLALALSLRACLAAESGRATRASAVVVTAGLVALAASAIRLGPEAVPGRAPERGSPEAIRASFRRGRLLALGAVLAWALGAGSCAVAFTTDASALAAAAAGAGLLLMLVPPLLVPRLLRCPACAFETLWQGLNPETCRSCGARLR